MALTDRKDGRNQEAKTVLTGLAKGRHRLFTTMYIVVEAHASILRAMNPAAGRQFLTDGLSGVFFLPTTAEDEENAKALILTQRDKGYSLCDAISFVVMQRFGLFLAFAYDDHFRQHGFSSPLDRQEWPQFSVLFCDRDRYLASLSPRTSKEILPPPTYPYHVICAVQAAFYQRLVS
ncbi:MAG: hypothetical protein HYY30_05215 [Chloroflexi bacterium]|nr:hypothetical protein [Chloroflexota bacterium]